jgi:hypothetical protein
MKRRYPLLPSRVCGPDIYIPLDTQAELRSALGRNHPSDVIAVYDPDGWHLESRDSRAQLLRRAGVHDLARRVSSAIVPSGHVLVLADLEQGTNVTTLPVATVFGAREDEVTTEVSPVYCGPGRPLNTPLTGAGFYRTATGP